MRSSPSSLTSATTSSTNGGASQSCRCIGPLTPQVTVPIHFNNTRPRFLQYTLLPLSAGDEQQPRIINVTISEKDLRKIGNGSSEKDGGKGKGGSIHPLTPEEEEELDLEELYEIGGASVAGWSGSEAAEAGRGEGRFIWRQRAQQKRQRQDALRQSGRGGIRKRREWRGGSAGQQPQQLEYLLVVGEPGIVALTRVMDADKRDALVKSGQEAFIAECPIASLVSSRADGGQQQVPEEDPALFTPKASLGSKLQPLDTYDVCPASDVYLAIDVRGIGPLQLSWTETWAPAAAAGGRSGKRETHSHSISHILAPDDDFSGGGNAIKTGNGSHRGSSSGSGAGTSSTRVRLPLAVHAKQPGTYDVALQSVRDACGNHVGVNSLADAVQIHSTQAVRVHSRPTAKIEGCGKEPIVLLDEKEAHNQVRARTSLRVVAEATGEEPWEAEVVFVPEDPSDAARADKKYVRFGGGSDQARGSRILVDRPGTYTLLNVSNKFCDGSVVTPTSCVAVEVPPPKATIQLDTIDDQCAGAVGVKARADLVGTPPFRLEYEVVHDGRKTRRTWATDRSRSELEFPLEHEGRVEYGFLTIADAYYTKPIALPDAPRIQQVVHPLATASFSGDKTRRVKSCEGDVVQAQLELQGVEPFELQYETRSSLDGVRTHTVPNLSVGLQSLDIVLQGELATKGGQLLVTLTKIRDSRGCVKELSTTDLKVNVDRQKPSVAFTPTSARDRQTQLLVGREATLPLTLTGNAPWKVVYTLDGREVHTTLDRADAQITVDRQGEYRLVSVSDATCPGDVVASRAEWHVTTPNIPTAAFVADEGIVQTNHSILRAQVCQGTRDEVALRVTGHFPVAVSYQHAEDHHHHTGPARQSLTAAQEYAYVALRTSQSGWHRYEINNVADTLYDMAKIDPPSLLEQYVAPNPAAAFLGSSKASTESASTFCLHDTLSAQTSGGLKLQLSGKAPYTVELDVQSSSASTRTFTLTDLTSPVVPLDLAPFQFSFDQTGRWSASLRSVVDGNGCRTEYTSASADGSGSGRTAVQFDVLETAGIASVGSREDFCIGESIDFSLRGSPPWTVLYSFNDRDSSAKARTSPFSRVAEKPGVLKIKSVAHGGSKCRLEIVDAVRENLRKVVHDLPSVKVEEGNHYVQDIVEGTQAEIKFNLFGQPPFSFTYQRTEPADSFTNPRVLETQTITGILEHTYSVFTSEEGEYANEFVRLRNKTVDCVSA